MQNSILLLFLLSLTVSTTFAQAPAQAPIGAVSIREAIVHQELARAYVAKKNWPKAREEAKLATSKAPNS